MLMLSIVQHFDCSLDNMPFPEQQRKVSFRKKEASKAYQTKERTFKKPCTKKDTKHCVFSALF